MYFISLSGLRTSSILMLLGLSILIANPLQAAIEKSPNDTKQYQYLTLKNGLEVLLISDPKGDKAAASMNIAVGSSANPKSRPGLAHFLEHMLFLGTDKYPKADEYQSFISSHGGSHNAYTAMENTNYFFDVSAEHIEPALDRFAQFFIAPRFEEKYVDRERNAVHSEYQAKIRDDYRRGYAVTKALMNPDNGHNRFAVGSLDTLSNRESSLIRDDLIAFYKRYYSANLMSLVVQGSEPLTTLENMVKNKFSTIKNSHVEEFKETASLFKANQLPQLVEIQSLKDTRSLTLTLPIPAFRQHWEKKPLYYISSLVGYEGAGSLLSELKNRGWATYLAASAGHDLKDEATFMVNIQLTETGLKHYMEVSQLFFQYIHLVLEEGIQPALYKEEKSLSAIQFRFQEKSEPIHTVSELAQQLQHYPPEKVISANYTFTDFDPVLIQQYLQALTPENLLITLKTKEVKGSAIEPDYQTPYNVRPLTKGETAQLQTAIPSTALTIRNRNPFIAENLDLITDVTFSETPVEIMRNKGLTLWHQADTSFSIPKANFYFSVQRPEINDSAESWVLNRLYISMVKEQLNEVLYDAGLAGLETQIYPHLKGYSVRLSGYNDKLFNLLKPVNKVLTEPSLNNERFLMVKQRLIEQLKNSHKDKPYNQTTNKLYELLLPQWSNKSQEMTLEKLTLSDLKTFIGKLRTPNLKMLAHGNIDKKSALSLGREVSKRFIDGQQEENQPKINVVQLPQREALQETLNIEHNDSAISLLLQGENNSIQTRAEIAIISEILSAPFYSELRTEKQLGYIVFATPLQMNKTPGLAFIIQSPSTPASDLADHIDNFLTQWESKLSTLDEATVQQYKQSILSRILQQDNKLSSKTHRYWRELDQGNTLFNSRKELAKAVKSTSLAQLKYCFNQLQNRRLTILNNGDSHPQKNLPVSTAAQKLASLKSLEKYVPDS